MRTHPNLQTGLIHRRVLLALAFCFLSAIIAMVSFATVTPTNGTLSPSNPEITYTGGPFLVPTNSTDGADGDGLTCDATNPCEDFALTVDIPQSYIDAHPGDQVQVEISWSDPSGQQDLDTWFVPSPDPGGPYSFHGTNLGDNPETYSVPISQIGAGPHSFILRVAPFISTGQAYTGKVSLVNVAAPTPTPSATIAPPPPTAPRYYNYSPGPGVGETAGEPSIGYNLTTHKAMYISGLQTLRVTFPETGACEANWEDVSYIVTKTRSLDPILFTDQTTGRTFVSQLDSIPPPAGPQLAYAGLNSFMAYTDNDGATWTPAQINPPDGSYDHQSVGAGPYPATLPLGNPVNKGSAVYYCSQAGLTAFCSRSDDGGLNFGRPTAIYNAVTDGCGGIHGHVKVAPDGTVYVPNYDCNGHPAIVVSENAGLTWTVREVANGISPSVILDPSVGIASDGTLYLGYIGEVENGDLHAFATVSHDKGQTWSNSVDLGAAQGLNNAVFIETVAGDPDRAAIGFVGTTESGNHESDQFKGTWYLFIAHTYDSGQNWVTVNATPDKPVQREAGIWNEGGSNPLRNLLDFCEITMDEKGRVLYGFADGCIDACETGAPNSFTAKASIAKQSGGKGLLAQYDPNPAEPLLPQTACLSGRRDDMASYLQWRVPDNGGSPLTSYNIYRGTDANNVTTLVGHGAGNKASFTDRTGDPSVTTYYYKIAAVNSVGEGPASNVVALTVGPRAEPTGACLIPGVQVLVDPAGDANDNVAQHDVTSLSMSEPQNLPGKIVFTMKVADLTAPVTPGWRWSVRFNVPNYGPPVSQVIGPQEDWFVAMVTSDGAAPTFTYGTTGSFSPNGVDLPARFFTTVGNLDPASTFSADGTITLILNKEDIRSHAICTGTCGALQPGQAITINLASVRATAPSPFPGVGGTNETIPDTTGPGIYNLRPANLCLSNTAPLAVLNANVTAGLAPLSVQFNGDASHDDDTIDSIATYTFNFGEGGDDVVQSTPTISHQFANPGLYDVKLVVTDSRGKLSTNTAHQLIQVNLPLQGIVSRKIHGAQTYDVDLPESGTPGIECRSGGTNGDYTIVYKFSTNIASVDSATLSGTGTVLSRGVGQNPAEYIVNLTGVTNAQHLVLTLQGAHATDGRVFNNVVARMDVLAGDTTADGVVNSADIAQTKSQSGKLVSGANFREDVTADGNINSADIAFTKSKSGTGLPPEQTAAPSAQAQAAPATTSDTTKQRSRRARR